MSAFGAAPVFVAVFALVVACGGAKVTSSTTVDASTGCSKAPPNLGCTNPCNGASEVATCQQGQWACPSGSPCEVTPPDDASLSCAQQTAEAHNAMLAAASQASLSCSSDSDCTVAPDNSICGDGYACGLVVNQAGAAMLQAAIAKVDATMCANFIADGCTPPIPPPCAPFMPSCVAGTCADFPGPPSFDAGDAAGDGATDE